MHSDSIYDIVFCIQVKFNVIPNDGHANSETKIESQQRPRMRDRNRVLGNFEGEMKPTGGLSDTKVVHSCAGDRTTLPVITPVGDRG